MSSDVRTELSVEHLTAGYGTRQVVFDIQIRVAPGEVHTLIGPNGSGKSTVLKAISGFARVFAGHLKIGGDALNGVPPWKRHRDGLCHIPQRYSLFLEMSVEENFQIVALMRGGRMSDWEKPFDRVADVIPAVSELLARKVGTLSGGERQIVAIARAFVSRPKVLLVDEPTQGLAERLVGPVLTALRVLAQRERVPVLMVEHRVRAALEVSDHVIGLRSGRPVWRGAADETLGDDLALAEIFGLAQSD